MPTIAMIAIVTGVSDEFVAKCRPDGTSQGLQRHMFPYATVSSATEALDEVMAVHVLVFLPPLGCG